jgi:hypothetical protein
MLSKLPSGAPQHFKIHIPAQHGCLLLITGSPELVIQFFRHYGHPKRNRTLELIQIAALIALAWLFPLGLVLSVTVMSLPTQYVWVSYHLYTVLAMYASRYMRVEEWASTEGLIARLLHNSSEAVQLSTGKNLCVYATLEATYHERRETRKFI